MSKPNREAELAVRLYRRRQETNATNAIGYSEKAMQSGAVVDAARLCAMTRALRRRYQSRYRFGDLTPEADKIGKASAAIVNLLASYGLKCSITQGSTCVNFPDAEVTL